MGGIGEEWAAGWCAAQGLDVTSSDDTDADSVIQGLRAEKKFSTLWEQGFYKIPQRRNQRHDIAICRAISPFDVHFWVLEKELIMKGIGNLPGLTRQHGDSRGTDTAWLQVNPTAIPGWLAPYGGRLSDGLKILKVLGRKK